MLNLSKGLDWVTLEVPFGFILATVGLFLVKISAV